MRRRYLIYMEHQTLGTNVYDPVDILDFLKHGFSKYRGGIIDDFVIPAINKEQWKGKTFNEVMFATTCIYSMLPLSIKFYKKWLPRIYEKNYCFVSHNGDGDSITRGHYDNVFETYIQILKDAAFNLRNEYACSHSEYKTVSHIAYHNAQFDIIIKQLKRDYRDKPDVDFSNSIFNHSLKQCYNILVDIDKEYYRSNSLCTAMVYQYADKMGLKIATTNISMNNSCYIMENYDNADVLIMYNVIILKTIAAYEKFVELGTEQFITKLEYGDKNTSITAYDSYIFNLLQLNDG